MPSFYFSTNLRFLFLRMRYPAINVEHCKNIAENKFEVENICKLTTEFSNMKRGGEICETEGGGLTNLRRRCPTHRWSQVIPDNETYKLKELDETPLADTVAGNRLKTFHLREHSHHNGSISVNRTNISQGPTSNVKGDEPSCPH